MWNATDCMLATLRGGPLHGRGIIEGVRRLSGGRLELTVGKLYVELDHLAEAGLVEATEGWSGDGRRRYQLTGMAQSARSEREGPLGTVVVQGRLHLLTARVRLLVELTVVHDASELPVHSDPDALPGPSPLPENQYYDGRYIQ